MGKNVGIVIVSHSPDVAKGAADMVRQMVGVNVPLAWCGGNPAGGLGTSVEAIVKALESAWSEAGVVIMVDMGGAETNSEMAIEMMPEKRRSRVVVCNGPVVEGSVMAATESRSGAPLDQVRRAAEELYSR
jgi:dihydroxyacetone kinase phosphotransfer subunit